MGGKGSGRKVPVTEGTKPPYNTSVKLVHELGRELLAHAEAMDASVSELVRRYIAEGIERDKQAQRMSAAVDDDGPASSDHGP